MARYRTGSNMAERAAILAGWHVPTVKKNSTAANDRGANVGYEAQLWQMADALRGTAEPER